MSVIIRLQNLPWDANALDIRRYFSGLSIPDGGVHIIGGENGDAFIAFSTDEDARQAMLKDGGRINGQMIKLLLSSKTEMQNVIAAAKGGGSVSLPGPGPVKESGPFYDRPGAASSGNTLPTQFAGNSDLGSVGTSALPATYGYPGNDSRLGDQRVNLYAGLPTVSYGVREADLRPMSGSLPPANIQQLATRTVDRLPPAMESAAAAYRGPSDVGGRGPNVEFGVGMGSAPNGGWGSSRAYDMNVSAPLGASQLPPSNYNRDAGRYGADPPLGTGRNYGVDDNLPRSRGEIRGDYGPPDQGRDFGRMEVGQRIIGSRDFDERPDVARNLGRDEHRDSRRDYPVPMDTRDYVPPGGAGDYNAGAIRRDYLPPGRDYPPAAGPREPLRAGDAWADNRRDFPPPPRVDQQRYGPPNANYPAGVERERFDYPPIPSASRFSGSYGSGVETRPGVGGPGYGNSLPPAFREPARPDLPPAKAPSRWSDEPPQDEPIRVHQSQKPTGRVVSSGGSAESGDLTVCVSNLPHSFNYREVRRFLRNAEIPREGLKLINDRSGKRTGTAYVSVLNPRSLKEALEKNGTVVEGNKVRVMRCSQKDFDDAVDSGPATPNRARSRSPLNRESSPDGRHSDTTCTFVIKRLPPKCTKADVKKFLRNFKIAPDGGPFFEMAHDRTLTGNVLVEIDTTDPSSLMKLNRSVFQGASINIINIGRPEFDQRTRVARQVEHEADVTSSRSSSSVGGRKEERSDGRPKESESRPSGVKRENRDRTTYCVVLRGVPFTTTYKKVREFFAGLKIPSNGIHIVCNKALRATGLVYVEFLTAEDQCRALDKNKKVMEHRYIEVWSISYSDMVKDYNQNQIAAGGPLDALFEDENDESERGGGDDLSNSTLCMRNLPVNIRLEDILDFFNNYHPIVDSIKLQYKEGVPTGDGLIGFPSRQEAENALRSRKGQLMLGKPVMLSMWSKS